MKTHEFKMTPDMWQLVETGAKTAECRIGDRAQRVKPGDMLRLVVEGSSKVLLMGVEMVMLFPSLAEVRGRCNVCISGPAGFDSWDEFEAAMREFYGSRVDREPFTVMCLEAP